MPDIIFKERFHIRPIESSDKHLLQEGISQLTIKSRRQRFFYSRKEFTENELAFFTEVDQVNHIALLCGYLEDDHSYSPAGTIRCVKNAKRPTYAELAVTIVDRFHHQGLGTEMMNQLSLAAQKQGIGTFYGDFQGSNTGMLKLLEKYCAIHQIPLDQFQMTRKEDGYLYFEMPLALNFPK